VAEVVFHQLFIFAKKDTSFPMPWPLSFFFCRIETFGRDCSSTTSLRVDDIVKGFLTLMLAAEGDEEKCSFFVLPIKVF
jgi:hypothetical protein